jgi:hypothetical protein
VYEEMYLQSTVKARKSFPWEHRSRSYSAMSCRIFGLFTCRTILDEIWISSTEREFCFTPCLSVRLSVQSSPLPAFFAQRNARWDRVLGCKYPARPLSLEKKGWTWAAGTELEMGPKEPRTHVALPPETNLGGVFLDRRNISVLLRI